jgi:hypothetical protein
MSTVVEPPSRTEKPHRTHGKYGAWKFIIPKKFILNNKIDHVAASYFSMDKNQNVPNKWVTTTPNIHKHDC